MDDRRLIPQPFQDNLKAHFKNEVVQKVLDGLRKSSSISIRNNPNKSESNHLPGDAVPWCAHGVLLNERPSFAKDPLFHAGCYYVQDSSSMILEHVLKQLTFNEEDGLLGLDMCAAPGGKSLITSDFIGDNGLLISNEIDGKRNSILRENVLKWGASNVLITQLSSAKFSETSSIFDLVVLDAPCSGEGMFRKDSFAIDQWSDSLISQCRKTQTSLLKELDPTIKAGGYLIYSTCTMNSCENEDQITSLLTSGYELVDMKMQAFHEYLVPAIVDEKTLGYYLLPGISTGEGLFICALKKVAESTRDYLPVIELKGLSEEIESFTHPLSFTHQWQPDQIVFVLNDPKEVSDRIPLSWRMKSIGLPVAEQKGKLLLPYHGLAMHPDSTPNVDLNLKEALNYLRKERISAVAKSSDSWQKVGHKGHCLGWVKQVPGRWNNYYPSYYRLRT